MLQSMQNTQCNYCSAFKQALSAFIALLFYSGFVQSASAQVHHTAAKSPAKTSVAVVGAQSLLGDVIPFGNGTARSWVQLDAQGAPTSVGITLTESALEGLPLNLTPGMIWAVEYILKLPGEAYMIPFQHIGVNWNPKGHMPDKVYTVPHFDFHFYTVTPEQRTRITARGTDLEQCRLAPAAGCVPEGYIFGPGSEEPGMGGHWVDVSSHEFHGKDFTSTFIYGTHEGKVIFWEPMITKAFIESKPNLTFPLKLPVKYDKGGYYPTSYSIRHNPDRKEYTISLDGMVLRKGIGE